MSMFGQRGITLMQPLLRLSKSFISGLALWSMTKNNAFGGEGQEQKMSNKEQSDFCDCDRAQVRKHEAT